MKPTPASPRLLVTLLGCALLALCLHPAPAAAQASRTAKIHHDQGIKHYTMGRFDEAIQEFEKAYDIDPHPTLLFNIAILLEDLNRPGEAADMYRAALEAIPDLPDAHYNLALLCEAAGQKQEAIRHLSAYRKLSKR